MSLSSVNHTYEYLSVPGVYSQWLCLEVGAWTVVFAQLENESSSTDFAPAATESPTAVYSMPGYNAYPLVLHDEGETTVPQQLRRPVVGPIVEMSGSADMLDKIAKPSLGPTPLTLINSLNSLRSTLLAKP